MFINETLVSYCEDRDIEFTRSRAYRKNDQAWIEQNGVPAGVDFVSVATSIDEIRPNYPPDAWLRREGWTQRVVVDSATSSIANAYGLDAFPYYVLVDGSGTVVRRISGGVSADAVGAMLEALAAGG